MARLSALFLVFLLGAGALTSCGGGDGADLLPGTTADQIESNLDQVQQLADEGDCLGAESAVAEVVASVEELQSVDRRLKAALVEGSERLSEVVGRCEEEETGEEAEPEPETDVEPEEVEDEEKPKKEKKDDEEPSEQQEQPAEDEGPELPPQSNGKGEEKGKGGESAPPAETPEETPPSGGVGPSVGVE